MAKVNYTNTAFFALRKGNDFTGKAVADVATGEEPFFHPFRRRPL